MLDAITGADCNSIIKNIYSGILLCLKNLDKFIPASDENRNTTFGQLTELEASIKNTYFPGADKK